MSSAIKSATSGMWIEIATPTMLTITREPIPRGDHDEDDDMYLVSAHYSDGAVHIQWSGQGGYDYALHSAEDLKKQMDWKVPIIDRVRS
jgi:hypothetical protein